MKNIGDKLFGIAFFLVLLYLYYFLTVARWMPHG